MFVNFDYLYFLFVMVRCFGFLFMELLFVFLVKNYLLYFNFFSLGFNIRFVRLFYRKV